MVVKTFEESKRLVEFLLARGNCIFHINSSDKSRLDIYWQPYYLLPLSMKSLSRQAPNSQSTSDLQAYGRNMTLTELLLKRSGDIRQSMMAGAATIGLEFICDDE